MPLIGRALGLILCVAAPACLGAQTYSPGDSPYRAAAPQPDGQYLASAESQPGGHYLASAESQPGGHYLASAEPQPGGHYLASAEPVEAPAVMPLAAPSRGSPLPLSPAGSPGGGRRTSPGNPASVVAMVSSLAVVLGVFFLVAWCMRRSAPAGSIALPGDVFEVLGRAAMAGRQQVYLLRCGKKLILVSVTPGGAETLTEITEEMEVDRLAGLCQQARPNSATAAFRQVFGQLAGGRSTPRSTLPENTLPEYPAMARNSDPRLAGAGALQPIDGLENRDV